MAVPSPRSTDDATTPLAGTRVLDLAGEPGAFCGRLLADMGAHVLKVEPPGGDPCRRLGPFLGGREGPETSLRFWYLNAGKRGVTLDLGTARGRSLLRGLASGADVVVETFQPGHLEAMDLGYRQISTRNPGLVMASITGFGQSGPDCDRAWSDLVAQAAGGQMYVCGDRDTPPLRLAADQAYYLASMFAAAGVLLALLQRRGTGRGQQVDISAQECVAATLDHVLPRYLSTGEVSQRQGSRHWSDAFRVFECRDGHIVLSLFQQWETLVEWLGAEGAAADLAGGEWLDQEKRRREAGFIAKVLARWTAAHGAVELEEKGQLMGFPWAAVAGPPAVCRREQLAARRFFVSVGHAELGAAYTYPGPLCRLSRSPWQVARRPPLLSEHNGEVVGEGKVGAWSRAGAAPGGEAATEVKHVPVMPLSSLRVLDLTRVVAGPYATRLLADFGAEVIKVERPGRAEPDPFASLYYRTWNRNKHSVCLDLSCTEGLALLERLLSVSDVLVENFSPRVMANWGLEYDRVRRIRPDIVMVSLSTMGQTGPQRHYAGYAPTVHAMSGLTHLTSFSEDRPMGPGHAHADHVAGLAAFLGTLSALEHRSRTGEGQHVDVSALEASCALLGVPLMNWLVNGRVAVPEGNSSCFASPHGCYRCCGEDEWCAISVGSDEEWRAFTRALGEPGWTRDGRFASAEGRVRGAQKLDRLVEAWTSARSAEQVVRSLQGVGIAAARVVSARELVSDRHLESRNFFVPAREGDIMIDASPIRLSVTPAEYWRTALAPGQDSFGVLNRWLGMSADDVSRLKERHIIG